MRPSRKSFGIAISVLMAASLALAAPVFAAAPGNDTYAGRTAIGSTPFSDSIDTSEATTDADDVEANAKCGAPVTDASVWYEITAASDEALAVNLSEATFSAGVIIATGIPGGFGFVTCGAFDVTFDAAAGQTYAILVFDFDGGGSYGGTLTVNVDQAPPPPTMDLTVDPVGQFDAKTGAATLYGTATCTGGPGKAFVSAELRQTVGRIIIYGSGATEGLRCDGTSEPWSMIVLAENGLFKGGQAAMVASAFTCDARACGEDHEQGVVKLRR